MQDYDAIIIGGGHNGLILGNYLVKAGLKTLILERRLEIGGGLSTEEITIPGFLHNLHSHFHDTINVMPPFRDLELEKFNARYHRPPVQAGIALKNGKAITMHADLDNTCASIARVSRKDAKAYREMAENYREFMEAVVVPALFTQPQPPAGQVSILQASPEGLDFLRMGRLSPKDVLDEYFENEHVKALILHQLPVPRGIVPDYHGLGTVIPLTVSQVEHSQLCIGGSHVLAHALWRAFFANGGMALGFHHVTKIRIENGEAKGVETLGGERFIARRLVASAVDLKQTFLDLVGEENLEEGLLKKIKNFKFDEFSLFGVHLALNEPPAHTSAKFDPDINMAFKLNIGLETPEDYHLLWSEIRNGQLPEHLGFFCSVPTLFDPTQAPKGKHTALIWQPVPYGLKDGGPEKWDEVKMQYMDKCIGKWREYAPNLTEDNILMKAALTPLDIERKLYNMKFGGVFMGRLVQGQLEYFRPLPELSQFRTPIKNLYLCGSCCHPGGGIIGAPGFIAANIIAEDYGLNKWWES
ncbi:MAG: NAD(P)/FAD-dependent oxidoreductase [Deltaproteobacteria bacterium]|nr:NAD(P)/FAD-dependent oxidoreductase [Deltaproteobacteria bacterium]